MINMDYKIRYFFILSILPKLIGILIKTTIGFFGKKEHAGSIICMKIGRFYKSQKKNKVGEFFIILFQRHK